MRSILCIPFIILIIAVSCVKVTALESDTSTNLPIQTEGLKERDFKGTALTDAFNVNIFTAESKRKELRYEAIKEKEKEYWCGILLQNSSLNNSFYPDMTGQEYNLFKSPCNYSNHKNEEIKKSSISFIIILLIIMGLGSLSFFAALAFNRVKKSGNSNRT